MCDAKQSGNPRRSVADLIAVGGLSQGRTVNRPGNSNAIAHLKASENDRYTTANSFVREMSLEPSILPIWSPHEPHQSWDFGYSPGTITIPGNCIDPTWNHRSTLQHDLLKFPCHPLKIRIVFIHFLYGCHHRRPPVAWGLRHWRGRGTQAAALKHRSQD